MALELTPLAVVGAVVASLGTLGVAVIVLYLVGGLARKVSSTDKLVLVWLIYNAFTHFVVVRRKRGCGRAPHMRRKRGCGWVPHMRRKRGCGKVPHMRKRGCDWVPHMRRKRGCGRAPHMH